MKCPSCGQWNRDTNPRCMKCGAFLFVSEDPEHVRTPEWKKNIKDGEHGTAYYRMDDFGESDAGPDSRDRLAEEMAALKERKNAGSVRLRRMHAAMATDQGDNRVRREEKPREAPPPDESPAGKRGSRTVVRVRGGSPEEAPLLWDDRDFQDPLWAEQARYTSLHSGSEREIVLPKSPRSRLFHDILIALAIVMGIAVISAGIHFGPRLFGRGASADANGGSIIVASIRNELAAHIIRIPGNDGDQVFIRELYSSYEVVNGYAEIEVEDHEWYDKLETVTDETMEVTLTPYLKTADGRHESLPLVHYTIDIPASPITLNSPESLRTTVSSTIYTIELEVRPGSTVRINGKDVSDTVNNDTGILSYNASIQPKGDNVFTVTCRSPYCRESSLDIVLYREPQEIPLDIAADTYTSTTLKQLKINCKTLPGAEVDVLSGFSDLNVTDLDTSGDFSFYAVFDHIGDNVIRIQSSYPGKKTSVLEYTVYYCPSVDVYTKKAWPLDANGYSELVSNLSVRVANSQVYVVIGTIDHFISEKPQIAVVYTSADGLTQPVVVQNYSKSTWEVGEHYNLYADAFSSYSGMPWLNVRFTVKK